MSNCVRRYLFAGVATLAIATLFAGPALSLLVPDKKGRFDALVVYDPAASLDVATTPVASLNAADKARAGWDQFKTAHGPNWSVYLDRRSGAPLLVEGQGIPWPAAKGATIDGLAKSLRAFMSDNKRLVIADDAELVVNPDASGELIDDVHQVVFDRYVSGIPVEGERYMFTIGHGNLMSFGAPRWSRIETSPIPDLDPVEAQDRISTYMNLTASDAVEILEKPKLWFIALRPGPPQAARVPFAGAMGTGYSSALVWRVVLSVSGDQGTWVAMVDAHSGEVRAFYDDNKYARVKGGVYPESNDGNCPTGCEQAGYPMPFAKVTIGSSVFTATSAGAFTCTPAGGSGSTALAGQFFKVVDSCGLVFQQVTCDADLDLGASSGTDCTIPAGASNGDTPAARGSYYHLNPNARHPRGLAPPNLPLTTQVQDNVNINAQCNAFWGSGQVNFYRSGGGCSNTGELAGIFLHEWGHGLDQNDGGNFDNPSEAYADITALLSTHDSCGGRGFQAGNCGGYGDACLSCTGVRDLDYLAHTPHSPLVPPNVPATPQGFVTTQCPAGTGPCGHEVHCEGYVAGETIWDLATRKLTAAGLDLPTSWQLVDKLWYKSRTGSGGNAYNCSLPSSDGCSATSWFSKMRAVDDDDGNLANGTPHAAAIFAAFNDHGIACGTVDSQSNQNSSSCPTIGAPTMSSSIGNGVANLSWTPVPNATAYRVLRNEFNCGAGSTIVATVSGTSYTDTGLGNGMTEYYTIQAVGGNAACDGVLSNCQAATPQPFAGSVKVSAASFSCNGTINVTVTDANIGASTSSVSLVSNTETTPETITVTQISPGSDTYTGTINTTSAAPVHNGVLSVTNGDTITATYIDAADGGGGLNIPRNTTASVDCVNPVISKVQATNVTGSSAKITWTTNEPASSAVHYGPTPPPGSTTSTAATVLAHGVDISGLTECTNYAYSVDSTDVVGNLATDNASGAYYGFTTGHTTQTSYASADTPVPIPDNSVVGGTSTITVTDNRTVQDVNVTINVQHTFDSDLTFTLTSPTGVAITLANPHGGSGDNYINTVFDDEAASAITGSAPFTGTFRPDSPLYVVDGIPSAGAWQFKAVDRSPQDTGQILNWTLQLTYATPGCAAHAVVRSLSSPADTCATGGPGSANGFWDAGEQVQFRINVVNDGAVALTGASAVVTPLTPGVTMVRDTALFPNIAPGSAADSSTPNFAAHLPSSLACGAPVSFQVSFRSDQGSWSGTVVKSSGQATGGTGRLLNEGFDAGIPATWTVLDGGAGGGLASKWTASNPGVRTIAPPMFLPVVTVDSDAAGPGATQDESLLTPVVDLTTATTATLQFDEFFKWYSGGLDEIADVDVRSSATGNNWVNVLHHQGGSTANPAHQSVDISAQAAGAANAQIRFHSWNGSNEQYWQVDNVILDASSPGNCAMPSCSAPVPGGAKPVADGVIGAPMRASRANPAGTSINLTWDMDSCASADHHVLYGDLSAVASVTPTGAACDLGTTGSAAWAAVPAGDLWFVVVGDDNATTEGTWGTDGVGGQRGGATASMLCGTTTRDNSGVCP